MKMPVIAAAFSLLSLMALAACSGKVDIDAFDLADLETPMPLVEQLPITVGVHYDDKLRNHYHREEIRGAFGPVVEYYLGPPSIALFEPLFSKMFETVVPVESPSAAAVDGQKLSGVLSLTIESFVAVNVTRACADRMGGVQDCLIQPKISYTVALYAPPGVKKTSIKAYGIGDWGSAGGYGTEGWVALAMRNAAADLVVNFYKNPEVVAWLASLGISEHGAEKKSQ